MSKEKSIKIYKNEIETLIEKYKSLSVKLFENNDTIFIENNLERWMIVLVGNKLRLNHTNSSSFVGGKFNSYHLQFERFLSLDALQYMFSYIINHKRDKFYIKENFYNKENSKKLFKQII